MSYLQFPRLIFSGKFQADPSTVNNDPEHFDTARFQPNYDEPGAGASNGWWNPKGTGAWRFKDCAVQQVQYLDGSTCDSSVYDSVVGMPINSVVDRVEGKLVDLDPEQQMVSQIWGFQVFLGAKGSDIGFGGDFEVAAFADIWVRFAAGQPDSFFGAFYQSVINLTKDIVGQTDSRFLQELQTAIGQGKQLSIRFNVDGFVDDATQQDFTFGRVTGAIGAYTPGEPQHFVAGRAIDILPKAPIALNTAYAQIQGNHLHLDLGNSLPTSSAGGDLVNFGGLYLGTTDSNKNPISLGQVPYTYKDWYTQTAGMISFALDANQLAAVTSNPLVLAQVTTSGITPLAAESADGIFLRADRYVFRFNPPEQLTAVFYATQFGHPMDTGTISFVMDNSQVLGQQLQGPLPGPTPGTPNPSTGLYPFSFPNALNYGPSSQTGQIQIGANGMATLEIATTDPGNPRVYIDGQLFGFAYQYGDTPPKVGDQQNPSEILNLLIFDQYVAPKVPTWIADVSPILTQYAELYPIMKRVVDLSNYGSVMKNRNILKMVFSTPESDPNYMPVTRDLSKPKRDMLLQWLDSPAYFDTHSLPQLLMALQTAIELEHSTIPPYLTALYSLQPGANDEVAGLIRGVVIEEMLHMHLACNILIAIGGSPQIGKPGFIPSYPGSLPGGLRPGLTVSLKKCSIEHIRDVFMGIEMPEELIMQHYRRIDPKLHARLLAAEKNPVQAPRDMEYPEYTIGWFYDQIIEALENLDGQITYGNFDKQVGEPEGTGQIFIIRSLDDAKEAIKDIKEQGEGKSATDPYDGYGELSHYYKFSEIVEGRQIFPPVGEASTTRPAAYSYTGPKIPFNPDEVWPMIDNPSLANYPPGSRAEILSQQFAESYQALLNALHTTFNGNPKNMNTAIGTMYSLGMQAAALMQTPSGIIEGQNAGPKFVV
jgi:hypothetical protein